MLFVDAPLAHHAWLCRGLCRPAGHSGGRWLPRPAAAGCCLSVWARRVALSLGSTATKELRSETRDGSSKQAAATTGEGGPPAATTAHQQQRRCDVDGKRSEASTHSHSQPIKPSSPCRHADNMQAATANSPQQHHGTTSRRSRVGGCFADAHFDLFGKRVIAQTNLALSSGR
jgi:hypothetical protein